ncbi:hypothetical protein ACX4ER_000956 [Cronobacter dublinensis]|nr:hypothetical protein [Cronobacter dublinensis]EMD9245965.1 hypothetical protein [Cronobacter dublinensis]MDI6443789.1 hypothetical protein [Cronobacter dublinensis]
MSQQPDYDEPVPSDKPVQDEPGQEPTEDEGVDLKTLDTISDDITIRLV